MIDIANNENEEVVSVFQAYRGNLSGIHFRPPIAYALITERSFYLLNIVYERNLFSLEQKVDLAAIDHILVSFLLSTDFC